MSGTDNAGCDTVESAELNELFSRSFPRQEALLRQLLKDVQQLYRGEWAQWQPCQVAYHNIEHIQAVLTVALQILAGHSKRQRQVPRTAAVKVLAAAALFHDSGYLKEKNDTSAGSGGQYTFEHVERSQLLAHGYCTQRPEWTAQECQAVSELIGATKIDAISEPPLTLAPEFDGLVEMLASADLLAQMADVFYLDKLPQLYAEFVEAYAAKGRSSLRQSGFLVFDSYGQLLDSSADFIRQQVLPRLQQLGNQEQALQAYFGVAPSPYMQQLMRNLHHIDSLPPHS